MNERFESLMWNDDVDTFTKFDRKGKELWEYLMTIREMQDSFDDEEYEDKYMALKEASRALYKSLKEAAEKYCDEARKGDGFQEYAKEHSK